MLSCVDWYIINSVLEGFYTSILRVKQRRGTGLRDPEDGGRVFF
jgi:hypothetical protein